MSLGEKDLELKTKLKDVSEWEVENDLTIFGDISEIESSIIWPGVEVKQIFSPPKGRQRKNIYNISQLVLMGVARYTRNPRLKRKIHRRCWSSSRDWRINKPRKSNILRPNFRFLQRPSKFPGLVVISVGYISTFVTT